MTKSFSPELLVKLRNVLSYDPLTGQFTWLVKRRCQGGYVYPGDVAGKKNRKGTKGLYPSIGFERKTYSAHLLAYWFMTGEDTPPGYQIDHKDRNRRNNVWTNLRLKTPGGNTSNKSMSAKNTSGHRGVCRTKNKRDWHARISVEGVTYLLGNHKTLEAAVAARRAGELKYLGEYVSDRDRGAM